MGIGEEYQTAALTGERYFYFLLALLLIFGISFEIPLLIVSLNLIGVLEYEHVKDKRRIIIVVVMIFAAFVTPGQDPFSMVVLAGSLILLIEIAFQFCRIHDKRMQRQRPEWMDLDDEAASPLGAGPDAVGGPTPVAAPTQVHPSPAPSQPVSQPVQQAQRQQPQTWTTGGTGTSSNSGGFFDDVL